MEVVLNLASLQDNLVQYLKAYDFHRILVPQLRDIWSIIYDIILTVTTHSSMTQGHDDPLFIKNF